MASDLKEIDWEYDSSTIQGWRTGAAISFRQENLIPEGWGPINAVSPVVSNVAPASGTPISVNQVLTFDVDDDSTLFRRILLKASFSVSSAWDLVHDGDDFGPSYQGPDNVRTATGTGYSFSILRDGGWTIGDAPILTPYAIDTFGNENA